MKRLRFLVVLLILIAGMLMGCTPQPDQGSKPQTAAGGVASDTKNINIKEINMTQSGGNTVVTFSLLSGSRKAGYAESKLTQLPSYQIKMLDQPQRLMVKFDNISFWDYDEQEASLKMPDSVLGLFREVPADNSSLIIYIQLSRSVAFDVQEEEGNLIVTLTPQNENSSTKYYCASNAFYEHQEGRWPDAIDMQPVLCSDLQNKLLISQPFDTQEEARRYLESIEGTLKDALPDAVLSVISVTKNALPDFSTDIDYSQVENRRLLMKDDNYLSTSVLLENGRYLDTAKDGRIAFSRRYKPEEPSMEQDNYLMSERLWILDNDGRAQNVGVSEFFSIVKAKFSSDGRYLAILDSSIENSVLYVYDLNSGTLINLGEEGFGSQTADFAWGDLDNTLYAMTGNNDTKQMRSCVFSEDGGIQIQSVEEQEGAQGSIAVWKGRIFFADREQGKVYEIGETRRYITDGVDIAVQSDSNSLLVLEAQVSQDEQVTTGLKLCDIESGETVYITQNADIADFGFIQGGKVYYLDAKIDNSKEGYQYGLFAYADGSLEEIAICGTDEFVTSASSMLYFIDYLGEADNGFYATFTYDLK